MAYGTAQHSITSHLEWNLFTNILREVHAINYVLLEMEGIYKVTICMWDIEEWCVEALAMIVA